MAELCNSIPCRLCLEKQFQLLPIFPANEPVNDELLRKIYECASVRISYEYDQSSNICIKCIVDVEQFYAFRQRCMKSDLMFQKLREDVTEKDVPDEGEFEGVLPETEFIEPITNLESPRQSAPRTIESFAGQARLVRIGYNYRIVRVSDETDVLIYRKHRFYQPGPKTVESNKWTCVAKVSTNCPARITIPSSLGYPVALFTKAVRHNHGEDLVEMIGTLEPGVEEIVHSEPDFVLIVDSNRRIRFLVGGYRYRLRNANVGGGMSLWCCEQSNCSAFIHLSYDDSPTCTAGDKPHCHEAEVNIPTYFPINTENMIQHTPKRRFRINGLNYLVVDGALVSRGNYYKPDQSTDGDSEDSACVVWTCRIADCDAKVEILRNCIATYKGSHSHARQIKKASKIFEKQTIQQGVNYRLVFEEHGYVRLKHAKQQYILQSMFPTGTTEWVCICKVLGCKATLRMLPNEQIVYKTPGHQNYHEHRVGNAIEQHFLPADAERAPPGTERKLWCASTYDLLWNRNSKPIILRQDHRYYGRKAYVNGTIEWHCVRGVRTPCDATITMDKFGKIVAEHAVHDHGRKESLRQQGGKSVINPSMHDILNSPGPVRLLPGGFNYRRIHDDHLNVDIIVHVAHKYLPDGPDSKGYHCILADEPQACHGKVTLTNNALCAEIVTTHNHLARTVPKMAEPDRTAQCVVKGPNYELIYSMTGRNCTLLYEGQLFRVYKLVEPLQTSRWRCIHTDAGCKAYLSVPLTFAKPATMDDLPHDHSRVKQDSTVKVKEEAVDNCMNIAATPQLLRRSAREKPVTQSVQGTLALINPTTSDDQSHDLALSMFQDIRGTLLKQEIKPDPDAMTSFLNGHLYVRQFSELESLDTPEWLCAFHWTLGCNARSSGLSIHTHERFAAVRTYDRFNMLKTLISQGLVAQRGAITQMPQGEKVSEYELMPSNGNFSLIIDENRYYFYKAKNNGEWLWRCIRYRWQGCKIGVAVSHCFGKYYYQPYGNTEHVHPS